MRYKILIVEDSVVDQKLICGILEDTNQITCAGTVTEAKSKINSNNSFDLILLDIDLPDGNGFNFFSDLQSNPVTKEIPVIFISMRAETANEVLGFSLGAEDFIAKPYDPIKIRARIESRLKKIEHQKKQAQIIKKQNLILNITTQRVLHITENSEEVLELTPLEFKLLAHMMRHEDHVFSREQLIDLIWGKKIHVIDRTVDMHISNLRKKLTPTPFTIRSVHGVGYRFTNIKQGGNS